MNNTPKVKLGIVAVSRDCFPMELSTNRRKAVVEAFNGEIYECKTTIECISSLPWKLWTRNIRNITCKRI